MKFVLKAIIFSYQINDKILFVKKSKIYQEMKKKTILVKLQK